MKTNIQNHHHVTIHQRIERFCHHRVILVSILSLMAIGLLKHETRLFSVLHEMYNQGFGMVSTYAHHEEVTRMPVQYGSGMRNAPTSGE